MTWGQTRDATTVSRRLTRYTFGTHSLARAVLVRMLREAGRDTGGEKIAHRVGDPEFPKVVVTG
jgi:hypothetical protein